MKTSEIALSTDLPITLILPKMFLHIPAPVPAFNLPHWVCCNSPSIQCAVTPHMCALSPNMCAVTPHPMDVTGWLQELRHTG